jgi:hypothetical protein
VAEGFGGGGLAAAASSAAAGAGIAAAAAPPSPAPSSVASAILGPAITADGSLGPGYRVVLGGGAGAMPLPLAGGAESGLFGTLGSAPVSAASMAVHSDGSGSSAAFGVPSFAPGGGHSLAPSAVVAT